MAAPNFKICGLLYSHPMQNVRHAIKIVPERSEGLLFCCKFRPCVTHSTRKWLRARQKNKRLSWYWSNLNNIKISQFKPGSVVWGRVLKELDLRLPAQGGLGFPYTGWRWTTNPSSVRARPRGTKSSIVEASTPGYRFWSDETLWNELKSAGNYDFP